MAGRQRPPSLRRSTSFGAGCPAPWWTKAYGVMYCHVTVESRSSWRQGWSADSDHRIRTHGQNERSGAASLQQRLHSSACLCLPLPSTLTTDCCPGRGVSKQKTEGVSCGACDCDTGFVVTRPRPCRRRSTIRCSIVCSVLTFSTRFRDAACRGAPFCAGPQELGMSQAKHLAVNLTLVKALRPFGRHELMRYCVLPWQMFQSNQCPTQYMSSPGASSADRRGFWSRSAGMAAIS